MKAKVIIIFFSCSTMFLFEHMLAGCKKIPDTIDPAVLTSTILKSDMVRIFDTKTKEVLFECRDLDDIKWLSEVFIVDRNSPCRVSMAWMRYRLVFYHDSIVVANIGLQRKLRFHWVHSTWENDIDFLLTAESYGEVLPWLCEKSGKQLNELFPVADWIIGIRERPLWD